MKKKTKSEKMNILESESETNMKDGRERNVKERRKLLSGKKKRLPVCVDT